jgi:hypothetical protein
MQPLRLTGGFTVALVWLATSVRAAGSGAPEDVGEIAREILDGAGYQDKLVEPEKGIVLPHVGSVLQILLLLALGVAGALLLIWLIHREIERRRREAPPDAAGTGSASEPPREEPTLTEVERLAAAGRFGEAVHVLLHLAVDRLGAGREARPADACTSRELARILPRTGEERTLFLRLVTTVEHFLFGDRPVNEKQYRTCFEAFQRLAP